MDNHHRDDEAMEQRIVDRMADAVVLRLIDAAKDKTIAGQVMEVWGGELDRTIGRGLRRAVWYAVVALFGIGAVKFGLVEKFLAMFKP